MTDRGFASDNASGCHPEVLMALAEANVGHVPSYGGDPWTARLADVVRREFGQAAEVYPVFSGTGANVLSLLLLTRRWDAVVCPATAHINVAESGAPEKVAGVKLLPVDCPDGKLRPADVERAVALQGNPHVAQPRVVSITNATEVGTVYTPDEVRALGDVAHRHGVWLHADGTRLGNAAARLGCTLGEAVTGVDVLSLGGTKNGLLGAEAVVVLNPEAVADVAVARKMVTQLSSKMRFLSAQLLALYEGDLWRRSASHANAMADRVAAGLAAITGVRLERPVEANLVFVTATSAQAQAMERHGAGVDWTVGQIRLVTSFDTTEGDVDALLADVRAAG